MERTFVFEDVESSSQVILKEVGCGFVIRKYDKEDPSHVKEIEAAAQVLSYLGFLVSYDKKNPKG